MSLHRLDSVSRRYLREMGTGRLWTIRLEPSKIDVAEVEVRSQHPEEPFPRQRAIARLAHKRHKKRAGMRGALLALFIVALALILFSLKLNAQTTSVDIKRIGGTLVVGSVPITCISGCTGASGTQDINFLQFLGATPSNTNPVPVRLTNGTVYFDARDRNWTLNSATDSVTIVGSIGNTTFAATQGTSPWVISGAVTTSGTATVSGTVTADQGAANATPWNFNISSGSIDNTTFAATQGTSPWVVSGAVTSSGTATVIGTLTTNNAAPAATNVGVLPAVANAAQKSYTEANQVLLSTDLKGNTRIRVSDAAGNDRGANVDASNRLTIDNASWIGSTAPTVGSKTSVNSLPVVIASDQGSIPVAATLGTETTKVIGTVRVQGNVGGVMDTTQNATVPANSLSVGCNFTTSPATVTTGNQGAVQCNSKGELLSQLTDGTTGVAVIAGTTALKTDLSSVAGTATVTGGVAGVQAVGGNVANAVAATANPVPVGGIFTTTPATLATGQTATMQFTAAQNLKHDLTTIAGTAPTTVGKLDVKGADGDVFVRQATATNLNAAVVGTGTAGTPAGNILTVQGVASMTKLLVTPDSVALPANQSVNVAQVAGTNTVTGGVAGIMAVGGNVANAVTATANPVPVGGIFTTTPATLTTGQTATLQFTAAQNAKTDLTTVAGTATVTAAAGVQKVGIVGNANAAVDAATGAAPPANAILLGGLTSGATGGFVTAIPVCDTYVAVNISTITTTLAVTGVSGRHVRICSINLVTAAANNVDLISGTGATCGSGTAGITGGTTAASGWNFAANGGLTLGNGLGTVLKTIATGDSVCIVTSATTQLSGGISYTIY